jgi:uncharacterized membrane protein YqaE (UPF0057 family)
VSYKKKNLIRERLYKLKIWRQIFIIKKHRKQGKKMGCIRILLAIVLPPLAVLDKGCGAIVVVTLLTIMGWVPGVIGALVLGSMKPA